MSTVRRFALLATNGCRTSSVVVCGVTHYYLSQASTVTFVTCGVMMTPTTAALRCYARCYASSHASSSSSSPTKPAPILQIPTIRLTPPTTLSHEHLAYAHCPICRQYIHMCDMYLHLTSKHKELHPKHCLKTCQERLALYESVMGEPLRKLSSSVSPDASPVGTAVLSGDLKTPNNGGAGSGRLLSSSRRSEAASAVVMVPGAPEGITMDRWLSEFLPTIISLEESKQKRTKAGYVCNWCQRRDVGVFATRDLFLKHVAAEHPELDIDLVDEKVPQLTAATLSQSKRPTTNSSPVRRLTNVVQGIAEEEVGLPPAPMKPLLAVKPNVSLRRGTSAETADEQLMCEVCSKPYPNELFLLNHMENAHPYGDHSCGPYKPSPTLSSGETADATSPTQAADEQKKIIDDVRRYQQFEMSRALDRTGFAVKCPKCPELSQRPYTRPSALYSHLRFKHPEITAAEAETMVTEYFREAQRSQSSSVGNPAGAAAYVKVRCPGCSKVFGSSTAMEAHFKEKHSGAAAYALTKSGLRLGELHGNVWWCNGCEKGFPTARGLHSHLVNKHSLPTEIHPCPACKRVFGDIFSLQEHVELSHKKLDSTFVASANQPGASASGVECQHCDRRFLGSSELAIHERKHHQDEATHSNSKKSSTATQKGRRLTPIEGAPSTSAVSQAQPPNISPKSRHAATESSSAAFVAPTDDVDPPPRTAPVSTPAPSRPRVIKRSNSNRSSDQCQSNEIAPEEVCIVNR